MFGRKKSPTDRPVLRKDRTGMSPAVAGAILLMLIVVATYFGFSKNLPFSEGYKLDATFESANSIRPGSPVRIAGVNVGKVKAVQRAGKSDAATVTMELQDKALPIHKDATLKIRPRIFLEGNFFVDLRPGTPSSPTLDDGDTIPMTQTSTPVQLDEVLTALQYDARQDLKDVLEGLGTGLTYQPKAVDDIGQDPDVKGETAAQAFNDTYKYAGPAELNASLVNQAVLGTSPGDLAKLIDSFGKVAAALARNEGALQGFITNFNLTTAAFAAEETNLRASIRLLAPTLETANATFTDLNAAFPPVRAFARAILPGVRTTPATINAAFPWIDQTRRLLGPRELRGLVRELQPTTAATARLVDQTIQLSPKVTDLTQCLTRVILPTGDIVISDGNQSTGFENYKSFWQTMVGLAGEGQNFDGNGLYVRFAVGGGLNTVSTGRTSSGTGQLFGNTVLPPLGTRPKYPGRRPPYRPDVKCRTQPIPNLNGPAANIGPGETVRSRNATPRSTPQGGKDTSTPAPLSQPSIADELAARLNPFTNPAGSLRAEGEVKP